MTTPDTQRPCHGDVWEQVPMREGSRSPRGRFVVLHVCGHHDPPEVTGVWQSGGHADPKLPDSIPVPRFLEQFRLVEREES
jgi:hypothetical protein